MVVTAAWSIEHSGARHALIDLWVTCVAMIYLK
jgi:hypothetical protein